MTDLPATHTRSSATGPLHDPAARGFASDNYAGIHPEVLEAIAMSVVWFQSLRSRIVEELL